MARARVFVHLYYFLTSGQTLAPTPAKSYINLLHPFPFIIIIIIISINQSINQ